MSKQVTAERPLNDATKFPLESCREKLARRYGLDAVALSGPCEGGNLVDCVCTQMRERWDRVSKTFAGNAKKVEKLAFRLAESLRSADDGTKECVADLGKIGYEKTAAAGIAGWMKAYALGEEMGNDFDSIMNDVNAEPEQESGMAMVAPGGDDGIVDMPLEGLNETGEPGLPGAGEPGLGEPAGLGEPGLGEPGLGEPGLGEPGLGEPGMGESVMIELPNEVAQELLNAIGEQLGGAADAGGPPPLGNDLGSEPSFSEEPEVMDLGDESPAEEPKAEEPKAEEPKKEEPKAEEKPEEKKEEPKKEIPGEPADKQDNKQTVETCSAATDPKTLKEAEEKKANELFAEMRAMRGGHIQRQGQSILKLGPEMSINNTDQLGGHSGDKDLGKAKEKPVEDPKSNADIVHPEGYSAGGTTIQDGKTMGKEQKFDAKELNKSDVAKGDASLLGKEKETFDGMPKGTAEVPSQETPLMTKGTVIATITPKGILVQTSAGKRYFAKVEIKNASQKLLDGLKALKFDGDGKKFALAAGKIAKAECEGCTHIDTGKLEAEKFTNDAEKKPEDGGAVAGTKGTPAKQDEGQVKIETGKLEAEKFTNDAEKKPEGEKKAEVAAPATKTADKKIEEPKALEDGNVKMEGHSAGSDKFQDGKTMGKEQKPDFKEVNKSDVAKGDASLLGKEKETFEGMPKGTPEIPVGGGQMGKENEMGWKGDNVSTKGTVITQVDQSQKTVEAEAKVREARLIAAGAYVASLLQAGDITASQYEEELKKYAALPVQAIQALAFSTRKARERVQATAAKAEKSEGKTVTAGLGIPVVVPASSNEQTLKERLISAFKLTRDLDRYDSMGK